MKDKKWQIIDAKCSQCDCDISKYRLYVTKGPVFCSRQCYGAHKTEHVDIDVTYVKANIGKLKLSVMAEHLGITEGCLEKRIQKWRDKGLIEGRAKETALRRFFTWSYPEQMLVGCQ